MENNENMNSHLKIDIFDLPKRVRTLSENSVNLKSGELLHPGVIDLLSKILSLPPEVFQLYPVTSKIVDIIAQNWNIPQKMITLSAGSDPIISIIIDALGSTKGRIILQSPNYFGWHDYSKLRKLEVIPIQFGYPKKHSYCIKNFLKKINSTQPSLVVISNPNNPTGFFFNKKEMDILAKECFENDHLLVIDECFIGFANTNYYKITNLYENVILVRSFSKFFGLAGARIAMTIASEKITDYLARWRPDAAVSGAVLKILEGMLNNKNKINDIVDDIVNSREKFIKIMKKKVPEWDALPSSANFVIFYLNKQGDPQVIEDQLKIAGYCIKNVSDLPGLNSCIRIGIAHWPIMEKLIEKICEILKKDVK